MVFSKEQDVAEAEMTAMVTLLGTVALADGQLDQGERKFIASYVEALIAHVADQTRGAGQTVDHIRQRLIMHFEAVIDGLEAEAKDRVLVHPDQTKVFLFSYSDTIKFHILSKM